MQEKFEEYKIYGLLNVAIKTLVFINELSGKKFCAKFSIMQRWTSNPIADLKTSRG